MSDEIKQNPEGKSHKELRKEYTFNKLKGLGQEIIEEIEKRAKEKVYEKKILAIIILLQKKTLLQQTHQ